MRPAYLELHERGDLVRLRDEFIAMLKECRLCPRLCGVDRLHGEVGFCRTGKKAQVASYGLHFGEEGVLVGTGGSGTVFMANCNLACMFCQNFDISHGGGETPVNAGRLADIMLGLEEAGAHNLNLVTPSHQVPQILEALVAAVARGFSLPLVYNSGGYDSVDTLKRLQGVFDIYMPDMKYSDPGVSGELSMAPDYPETSRAAVLEMHRQVGDLVVEDGVAVRGLIVRHLVLPASLAGTREIAGFLAREVSRDTYLNVMGQYRPAYKASMRSPLDRGTSEAEYRNALDIAREEGLWRFS